MDTTIDIGITRDLGIDTTIKLGSYSDGCDGLYRYPAIETLELPCSSYADNAGTVIGDLLYQPHPCGLTLRSCKNV